MTWFLQAKKSYIKVLHKDQLYCKKTEASEDGMQKPASMWLIAFFVSVKAKLTHVHTYFGTECIWPNKEVPIPSVHTG